MCQFAKTYPLRALQSFIETDTRLSVPTIQSVINEALKLNDKQFTQELTAQFEELHSPKTIYPVQKSLNKKSENTQGFRKVTTLHMKMENGLSWKWKDPLGLRGYGFFHVKDDKIVFQRGYWDKLSFLKQHYLPIE